MTKKITVHRYASDARCNQSIRATLKALNLTKTNQTRELIDTPALRGMIKKVAHIVRVI